MVILESCAIFKAFHFPVYCAIRLVSIVLQDEADYHIYAMNFYIGPNKTDNYILLSEEK